MTKGKIATSLALLAMTLVIIVSFYNLKSAHGATFTSVASGDWNNQCTWAAGCNTGVPAAGDSVVLSSGHVITVSTTVTNSGGISGAGSLLKTSANSLTLSGTNTFGGGITLNAGKIYLSSATALGTGTLTINGGEITNGSGGLLTLTTNNSQIWNADFIFASTWTYNLDMGTGPVTLNANIAINSASVQLKVGGILSGSYSVTKNGSGELVLYGANTYTGGTVINTGGLFLKGANTTSGGVILNGGILYVQNVQALGSGTLTINGGEIKNGSGGGITVSTNNPQIWNGNFAYAVTWDYALNLGIGAVTLNANIQINTGTSGCTLTVGGVISGDYGVTKVGPGSLTLTGNNTFSGFGGLAVSAGVLYLNGASSTSGPVTLNSGQLNINNSTALGTGTLIVNGGTIDNTSGSPITLSTNNPQIWNNNFSFGNSQHLVFGTGSVTLNNNISITLNNNTFNVTIGGIISGDYSITKLGNVTGGLIFSGANTFSGGLTLSAGYLTLSGASSSSGTTTLTSGTLSINHAQALGTGTFVINGGNIYNSSGSDINLTTNNSQIWNGNFGFDASSKSLNFGTGNVTLNNNIQVSLVCNPTVYFTVGGIISGNYGITKTGSKFLVLSGANTYTGVTTVNQGNLILSGANTTSGGVILNTGAILDLRNSQALGSGTLTINGGSIANYSGNDVLISTNNSQIWNGNFSWDGSGNNINLGTGTVTLNATIQLTITNDNNVSLTIGGTIGGSYGLTKLGAGKLILSGVNNYTGATTITAGTLKMGVAYAIPAISAVTVNGTSFDLNGYSQSIGSLTGTTNVTSSVAGAVTLTIGGDNTSPAAYSGVIGNGSGTVSVVKTGTGTLTLSGVNTYTGSTTISNGTIQSGIANPFLSSTLAISSSGTLNLNNFNLTSAGSTSFSTSGTIQLWGGETVTNTPTHNIGSMIEYIATSASRAIKSWSYQSLKINGSGGTFTLPGTISVAGDVVIANGIFDLGSNTLNVAGSWTKTGGTFTRGTSTVIFNGNNPNKTITPGGDAFKNITINGTGGVWSLSGDLIIRNASLIITSGTFNAGAGTISFPDYNNFLTVNGGTFNANTGTIAINQMTLITADGQNFNNITVSTGGGSYDLRIATGTSITANGSVLLSIGMLSFGTLYAKGGVTVDSSFNGGGGILNLNGSSSQTFTINGGIAPNVVFNNSNLNTTPTSDCTFSSLSLLAGTFNAGSRTITFNSMGMNLTVNGGIFNSNTSTVKFMGVNSNINANNQIFNNVTLDTGGPGYSLEVVTGTSITINGTLLLTSGRLITGTINLKGNISVSSVFGGGNLTLNINNSGSQTMDIANGALLPRVVFNNSNLNVTPIGDCTFESLTLTAGTLNAGSGLITFTGISINVFTVNGGVFNSGSSTVKFMTVNSGISANGQIFNNFIVDNGGPTYSLTIANGTNITINGNLTLTNGRLYTGTINLKGNISVNSGFGVGDVPFNFAGTSLQTISGTGANTSFTSGQVTVNTGANVSLGATATITKLTIASGGFFNLNGNNFTSTTFINNGTFKLTGDETFTVPTLGAGNTVEYGATTGSRAIKSWSYTNLKINGGGGIFSMPGDITASGSVYTTSGTLALGTNTLTVNTDWHGDGGLVTGTTGKVSLAGNTFAHIYGTTSFPNLTIDTTSTTAGKSVNFETAKTQTITGTFTLTGVSGKTLTLGREGGYTSDLWYFNIPANMFSGSYIAVSNSGSANTYKITETANYTNSGNNPGWVFGAEINGSLYDSIGGSKISGVKTLKYSINGAAAQSASTNSSGDFILNNATPFAANDIITVYVSGDAVKASLITKVSAVGNLGNYNLYQNYTSISHEGSISEISRSDLCIADDVSDTDLLFTCNAFAPSSTFNQGLYILPGKTYLPNADVSIFGSFNNAGTYSPGSSLTTFKSTSAGKTITTNTTSGVFNNLIFNGVGGGWTIQDTATITGDLTMTAGTLIGTHDITVNGGDITGNGTIAMMAGTVQVNGTGSFGGTTDWTFSNLTFGDGVTTGTTTKTSTNNPTITGKLNIATNQTLLAGTITWNLDSVGSSPITNVKQVSTGASHTCFLKNDLTVWCRGYNNGGGLGDNTYTQNINLVQVKDVGGSGYLNNISQIVSGWLHNCALKSDGTVACWGENNYGQLGSGDYNNRAFPMLVKDVGGSGTLSNVKQLISDGYGTCALKTDNTAVCWGRNDHGQTGDGTLVSSRTSPVVVTDVGGSGSLSNMKELASGNGQHNCALKTDNTAVCWGWNNNGQLGDNTSGTDRLSPVVVTDVGGTGVLTNIQHISAGGWASCAVKIDGTALCWGSNGWGRLGDNTTVEKHYPVYVKDTTGTGNLSSVQQIVVGDAHACALTTDGKVLCWGYNPYGNLGNDSILEQHIPVEVRVSSGISLSNINQISSAQYYNCGLNNDGTVNCWGRNNYGQLGDGTYTDRHVSIKVQDTVTTTNTMTNFTQIEGGSSHTCVIKSDKTLVCWGDNTYGQLGNNTTDRTSTPVAVKDPGGSGLLSDIQQISAGIGTTCALKVDGTVYCWGRNNLGQVGDNTTTERHVPVAVKNVGGSGVLSNIQQINVGGYHTCALKNDNTVVCWGNNTAGEIGDNTTNQRNAPVVVKDVGGSGTLSGIKQVNAGNINTCAIRADNSLVCWGGNANGQIGDNTSGTNRPAPVVVVDVGGSGTLSNVLQVSGGYLYTCALKIDSSMVCWGKNGSGQVGDNTSGVDRLAPVVVVDVGGSGTLSNIRSISTGYSFTCGNKNDNSVVCWGYNTNGQVGDNSVVQRTSPVAVKDVGGSGTISNVQQITVGDNYECALKTDASLVCWGDNTNGQIGDLKVTQRAYPIVTPKTLSSGIFVNSGTLTPQTSTFEYKLSNNPYIGDNLVSTVKVVSTTYNNLKINQSGVNYSPSGNITTNNDFNLNAGTFEFDMSGYSLNVGGNFANSGVLLAGNSTLNMTSTSTGKTLTTNSSIYPLGNINFNGVGGGWSLSDVLTTSGTFTVTNSDTVGNGVNLNNKTVNVGMDLIMTNGKLSAGTGTMTIGRNWSVSGGTFVKGTSKVNLTGTGTYTMSGGQMFYNLETAYYGRTITASADIVTSNQLIFNTGIITSNSTIQTRGTGDSFINGGATITANRVDIKPSVSGSVNVPGGNYGTTTLYFEPIASDVTYQQQGNISGNIGIYFQSASDNTVWNTNNFNINVMGGLVQGYSSINKTTVMNCGSSNLTFAGPVNVRADAGSHIMNMQNATFNVTGQWLNVNGTGTITLNPGASTVNMVGGTNMTSNGQSFNNLTYSGSGSLVLQDDLDVNGDLKIQNGILNSNSKNINVGRDWNRVGGSFTTGTGKVTLDSAQFGHVYGDTTFYDLAIDTSNPTINASKSVNFAASSTQTVTHTLTLSGASSSKPLVLGREGGISSSQWNLAIPSSFTSGPYINVSSSHINVPNQITAPNTCSNFGNNFGWVFSGEAATNNTNVIKIHPNGDLKIKGGGDILIK